MTMTKTNKMFLIFSLMAALLAAFSISVQAQAPTPEPLPDLFNTSEGAEFRAGERPSPEVIRSREAEVDFSLLAGIARSEVRGAGPTFTLNLFEDASFAATITHIEEMDGGTVGMIGIVEGAAYSEIVMVSRDGALQATFQVDAGVFEVRFSGSGHTIVEIDQSGYPESAPPVIPERTESQETRESEAVPAADSGSEIDVLAVYTPAARNDAGGTSGIQLLIQQSILSTNNGYANSGVVQRVNLVGMREVSYNEFVPGASDPDRWYYALYRLTSGYWNGVESPNNYLADARAYREQYGADLVVMVTDLTYYCGLGWLGGGPGDAAIGYSVVQTDCIGSSDYSFQHEMGHNMGACHDWANTSSDTEEYCWENYSHGYQQYAGNFYTVMAYSPGYGFTRINRWSNPNLSYNGYLTGVPLNQSNPAYNTLTLNNTAYNVANYRQSIGPISASFSQPDTTGRVQIPRAALAVNASSTAGSIAKVEFKAQYNGGWHTLGTDTSASDGWEILWSTAGISQQTISLQAVITDSSSNTKTITRSNVLLSPAQVNAGGFESRASGGTEEQVTEPAELPEVSPDSANPAPQAPQTPPQALLPVKQEIRETLYYRSPGSMLIKMH